MTGTPILWCTACGASTKLVDKAAHERNCRLGPVAWTPTNPHTSQAKQAQHLRVANDDLANMESMANEHLANVDRAPGRNRASTTYRYRNPDKRRAYQRDLMRKRRASGKAA